MLAVGENDGGVVAPGLTSAVDIALSRAECAGDPADETVTDAESPVEAAPAVRSLTPLSRMLMAAQKRAYLANRGWRIPAIVGADDYSERRTDF